MCAGVLYVGYILVLWGHKKSHFNLFLSLFASLFVLLHFSGLFELLYPLYASTVFTGTVN